MPRGQSNITYRGRGGRGGGSRFNRTDTNKGLFADSIWHCDCTPRLPAEHFKVKKDGKNQGRWFFTCQHKEPRRCDFFLWDEDARVREEGVVLGGGRGEDVKRSDDQKGWSTGGDVPEVGVQGRGPFARLQMLARSNGRKRQDDEETLLPSPSPPYLSPAQQHGKRSAHSAGIDEFEGFPWALTGEEEAALVSTTDAANPRTPRKAQKTGVYATPATSTKRKLPWVEQESKTPATISRPSLGPGLDLGLGRSLLETPCKTPRPPASPSTLNSSTNNIFSASKSPSAPTRSKSALCNPAGPTSSLTSEALAALSSTSLPPEMLSNLRGILTKHDLRARGVVKGRDISRLTLKAKDAKIAELEARIASLEAQREVDRGIRKLKGQEESLEEEEDEDKEL